MLNSSGGKTKGAHLGRGVAAINVTPDLTKEREGAGEVGRR